MSRAPALETVVGDALISSETAAFDSPSRSRPARLSRPPIASPTEREPLLGNVAPRKKPFYRARPLWLVPFAITAAIVRGLTLAPRVEVFTQLACADPRLRHAPLNHTSSIQSINALYSSLDPSRPHLPLSYATPYIVSTFTSDEGDDDGSDDPRRLPSKYCNDNAKVQAGAARLQTIMTTSMGLLSALTTGFWGSFSQRHGRTKVLASATFGLFLTDLTFILVSTPNSIFAGHGHKLLIIAPIIEGGLGGWSTLQGATTAYISDCTSTGSRATIFSRFTGVFYLGFSIGPSIGGWIIRNRIGAGPGTEKSVTTVFWLAIMGSFINFFLVLFVFPESLSKEKQAAAAEQYRQMHGGKGKGRALDTVAELSEDGEPGSSHDTQEDQMSSGRGRGIIAKFLSPLALFLPAVITDRHGKSRKDWSLTLIACTLFGYFLAAGIYQLKYYYAVHAYNWGAEQLSYYISFMGALRASYLLVILPFFIATFKPKAPQSTPSKVPQTLTAAGKSVKPKPTKAHLAQEIRFDLLVTKISLIVDFLADAFVVVLPAPTYKIHQLKVLAADPSAHSQAWFIVATSLTSFGSAVVPGIQSLSLCIMQARALISGPEEGEGDTSGGVGQLLGALAVLQAVGQMILGPLVFGLIYTATVAQVPKAIFAVAAAILMIALVCIFSVTNPVDQHLPKKSVKGKKPQKRREFDDEELERGRSRVSKDLFGASGSTTRG
ncbi:major facilitator superfamily domain-containing protein [Mycena floridula]|nr:major facilitator superfamily domain-containing protein [Mycena floridula]